MPVGAQLESCVLDVLLMLKALPMPLPQSMQHHLHCWRAFVARSLAAIAADRCLRATSKCTLQNQAARGGPCSADVYDGFTQEHEPVRGSICHRLAEAAQSTGGPATPGSTCISHHSLQPPRHLVLWHVRRECTHAPVISTTNPVTTHSFPPADLHQISHLACMPSFPSGSDVKDDGCKGSVCC